MTMVAKQLIKGGLLGGCSAAILAVMPTSTVYAQSEQETIGVETIMVTAQRRAESIQRTAVAVSAISAETMDVRQMNDTKAIIFNAPNLTGNSNIGQSTATTFFIRGVGTTENLATADTSVGLYVDDVYVARQAVNNFQLFDIERVEVLRGPQGTLYGRNTNGGAIKIVTKKPDEETEFSGRVSYGNFDRYEAKLSANVPVSDTVFLRGGVLVQNADGWKDNITLNRNVDNTDYLGARLAARVLASDDVTLDFAFDWGRDKTNGGYSVDISGNRPAAVTPDLRTVVGETDARGFAKTWGLSANVAWDINSDFTLTSISGYRNTVQNLLLDLSSQPQSLFELDQQQSADQFSQEFQLNGTLTDRLSLSAGLYYFNETVDASLDSNVGITVSNDFETKTNSYAAFAQFDYELGPVTLVVGGRYTRDVKEIDLNAFATIPVGLFNFDTAELVQLAAGGQDFSPELKFGKFTPKLGINWDINEDHFAYASWTKGFRSGGWTGRAFRENEFVNFAPENVQSYEVGLKSTLFDGRVSLNNAAFYMKYDDLFNTLTINGAFTVQTADARMYGLESELQIKPTSWLDLFANVGLLDAQYRGALPANLPEDLQRAPSFQGKAGFAVTYPVGSGDFLFNGDVFHTGSYLVNPANLAFTAPSVDPDISRTGPFTLVNALVGYRFGDDGNYRISASCTNCLDEEYFDAITVITSGGVAYASAYSGGPRLYRVSIDARF